MSEATVIGTLPSGDTTSSVTYFIARRTRSSARQFFRTPQIRSMRFRHRAADGVVYAQYWYGRILIEGRGVGPDSEAGRTWIARAADLGTVEAEVTLGELMLNCRDGPREHPGALACSGARPAAAMWVRCSPWVRCMAVGTRYRLTASEANGDLAALPRPSEPLVDAEARVESQ